MKSLPSLAVLLLLSAVPARAVGPAPLWFVPASVSPGKDGTTFVSFLPPRPQAPGEWADPLWTETNRLAAWKACVGKAAGVAAEKVRPIEEGDTFRVSVPSRLSALLAEGSSNGFSVVRSRTNALSVVNAASDQKEVRPADSSGGRLFPDRGAGSELWFVSEDELGRRWSSLLDKPEGEGIGEIRAELQALLAFWDGHLDRNAPDRIAWLRAWRDSHPGVWPGLRFTNETGYSIEVEFDGKSMDLKAGANVFVEAKPSWTNGIPALSYKEKPAHGLSIHEEDYEPVPTIGWNLDNVEDIEVGLKPRRRRAGVPTFDLHEVLPEGFNPQEAGLDGTNFEVSVTYHDLADPEFVEPSESDPWKRIIAPRRRISSLRVSGTAFFEAATFSTKPDEYPYGETNVVVKRSDGSSKLLFRPWPSLVLTNALDRTLTNEVSVSVAGIPEKTKTLSVSPLDVDARLERDFERDFAANTTSLVVKITTMAAGSRPGVTNLTIVRGGHEALVSVAPSEIESLSAAPWPVETDKKGKNKVLHRVGLRVASISTTDKVQKGNGGRATAAGDVLDSPEVAKIAAHLASCPGRSCEKCKSFRTHLKDNGVRPFGGRLKDLSTADVALACYRIYLVEREGLKGTSLETAVNEARAALGASSRSIPEPRKENEP